MITLITPQEEIHNLYLNGKIGENDHVRFYDTVTLKYFFMNLNHKSLEEKNYPNAISHFYVRNFNKTSKEVSFIEGEETVQLKYSKLIWNCHPFDRLILDPSKVSFMLPSIFRAVI